MARLIDADEAKRNCERICDPYAVMAAKAQIDSTETVNVAPVVRCRECKKHSEANGKHYCKFWRMYCPDDSDFFCKAGERKEGAT